MDVVARVRAFASRAGEGGREVWLHVVASVADTSLVIRLEGAKSYLVRCRVLAEADVPVDAEADVLDGQLGDGLVDVDDGHCRLFHERMPVLQCASVLSIVCCKSPENQWLYYYISY